MSRTYRRKNAWNKDAFFKMDDEWLDHMSGVNPFPYIKFHRRKYNGLSHEKILERLNAKFHSDHMRYRESNRGVKNWAKWWTRNQLNYDLRMAIINGTEDELVNDMHHFDKKMNGWWLWWD